jgi:rare lipoprotein A
MRILKGKRASFLFGTKFVITWPAINPFDMKNSYWSSFIVVLLAWILMQNASEQTGTASYYANKFHNVRTASGELYHKDSLTAAHKTLPFGKKIMVTNLSNNKTVILKINDRLVSNKSVIDVSLAAAKQLDFIAKGLTKVKIQELKDDGNPNLENE